MIIAALFFLSFICISADAQNVWQNHKKDGFRLNYTDTDKAEVAKIAGFISSGSQTIKKFFGRKFSQKFEIYVLPDRKSLNEMWRKDWNAPDFESECWMVASGTAAKLTLLSPRVWRTEACEHNPDDAPDTELVLAHEMVHVFHAQNNPNPNFDGMDDLGWFVEGLAVYASGQLDAAKISTAREAIEKGKAPAELEKAWSGKYRYGVSGSLVKFIDRRFGRKILLKLLKATGEKELLGTLNLSEADFLAAWKEFVLKSG